MDEYLAWEREQSDRHEYVDGLVVAMAGSSPRHNVIEANFLSALKASLGRECLPFGSGQKIRIQTANGYRVRYADASAACSDRTFEKGMLVNPTLIVEVLSRSTEAEDRGNKWQEYRRISSLQDYLLVSQHQPLVEHYQRSGDVWQYRTYETGNIELLDGVTLGVESIYDRCWSVPSDEES